MTLSFGLGIAQEQSRVPIGRHKPIIMLSFPHLVVLFLVALIIFGPQKLPELARMLGKATSEFRKMTNDFRYALEDEVRELDRQTRIRQEEAAAAARAAQAPALPAPAGAVPREAHTIAAPVEPQPPAESAVSAESGSQAESPSAPAQASETVSVSSHEKSTDPNAAV